VGPEGPGAAAEILGVAGWQVRAQIAPAYAAGRVFCMGDAVHRHPPANGLGLNMSIADAYKAIELSNYQFNAHGIELGYRYRSDAIVGDGSLDTPPARDPQLYYQPTTRPGARVPHARLERGGVPVSSLDLVDDLGFALLTGAGGEAWAQAAQVAARAGVPVAVHVIGGPEGVTDPYGEWAARREVETSGCVLVRPDRHVAWRSARYTPGSARELPAVIEQAPGRQG
jgi:2,4-dichlorophenol 6-monooxygenase